MKDNTQLTEQELDNVTAGAELSDEELDGVAGGGRQERIARRANRRLKRVNRKLSRITDPHGGSFHVVRTGGSTDDDNDEDFNPDQPTLTP